MGIKDIKFIPPATAEPTPKSDNNGIKIVPPPIPIPPSIPPKIPNKTYKNTTFKFYKPTF